MGVHVMIVANGVYYGYDCGNEREHEAGDGEAVGLFYGGGAGCVILRVGGCLRGAGRGAYG